MSRYAVPGYEMVRLLGRGGMGAVYLARRVADGRTVALKVSRGQLGKQGLDRLRREAELLSRIESPYLPRFVEAQELEQGFVLAMEFVQGDPLQAYVDEGGGPEERLELARRALPGIAHGLLALHQVEIIHRDLKPANAILTPERCVLVDLGLARGPDVRTLTKTGLSVGTPAYLPPEQISGEIAGPAADLYQVGLIARDLLLGPRSAPGQDVVQEAMKRAVSRPEDPRVQAPWVPAPLAEWITAALHPTPSQRPDPSQHLQRLIHLCEQPLAPSGPPGDAAVATWLEGPAALGGQEGEAQAGAASTPSAGKPPASPPRPPVPPPSEAPKRSGLALVGSVLLLGAGIGLLGGGQGERPGRAAPPLRLVADGDRLVVSDSQLSTEAWAAARLDGALIERGDDGYPGLLAADLRPGSRLEVGGHSYALAPAPALRPRFLGGADGSWMVLDAEPAEPVAVTVEYADRTVRVAPSPHPTISLGPAFLDAEEFTLAVPLGEGVTRTTRFRTGELARQLLEGVDLPGSPLLGPGQVDLDAQRRLAEVFGTLAGSLSFRALDEDLRFDWYQRLVPLVLEEWRYRSAPTFHGWRANRALGRHLEIHRQLQLSADALPVRLPVALQKLADLRMGFKVRARASVAGSSGSREVRLAPLERRPLLHADLAVQGVGGGPDTALRIGLGSRHVVVPVLEPRFHVFHRLPPRWVEEAASEEGELPLEITWFDGAGFREPEDLTIGWVYLYLGVDGGGAT